MRTKRTRQSGFTFIEALIVIVIMGILVGVGVSGYREFSRRQKIDVVIRSLLSDVRTAQKNASSGDKTAPGCIGSLDGYVFSPTGCTGAAGNCTGYDIRIRCSGSTSTSVQKSVAFPAGVTMRTPGIPAGGIIFKSLVNGTNITSLTGVSFIVTDSGSTISKTIIVLPSGEVQ
jgi:prepilin-type N-terminal cleavage/methylation domain-containing protein